MLVSMLAGLVLALADRPPAGLEVAARRASRGTVVSPIVRS